MLISYNWLCELTGTKLNPEDAGDRLTNVGLAVDKVEARGDDHVLDVEVASNRPDCLSHVGVARELAVIENSQVSSPKSQVPKTQGKAADFTSVEIRDPDLCPRYAARVVRGVKIAPSPDWLAQRLETIGQRPINNVADITNYVLHELGQPLHAFDLAKLAENRIVVRRAAKGESIKTLDGADRKLDEQMLVIADAKRAVAVAGVMGGEDSEISNATTDVLIESAYFNPASVRRTARLLGLHTEASHRFERGADPEGVLRAQERCVSLICEIAGGVATEDALDVYPNRFSQGAVGLRRERVEAITGLRVSDLEKLRILAALGFELRNDGATRLTFTIPSWRHDIAIEEDLIEEIARHTGYDKIQTALPPASLAGEYHSTERRKRALRDALAAQGCNEAISFSFIGAAHDDQFDLIPAFAVEIERAGLCDFAESDHRRLDAHASHPLPGLLSAVRHNLNQGTRDISLFELGRVFRARSSGELPDERECLTLAATGGILEADKAAPARDCDFYDLKGALDAAVEMLKLPALEYEAARVKHLRAGQTAAISVKGNRVGSIGRLAESVAAEYKFKQTVFVAEIDLTALLEIPENPVLYSPLPRFPSIVRDVSLLLDRKVTVAELLRAAKDQSSESCAGAKFVGTYEGEALLKGSVR